MEKEIIDKVCDWIEDNFFNYIETKSRGHDEILKNINVSQLISDLHQAMLYKEIKDSKEQLSLIKNNNNLKSN